MRTAALLAILMLCACSARTSANFGAGAASAQSAVQLQVQSGSGFATAVGIAILGVMAYDYEAQRVSAPELAPDRKVSEQDCTRPIDYSLGNLRCK